MRKETKKESFIYKPEYPGGVKAMNAFIQSNLKYPKRALEEKIEGRVRIKIDIDRNGKVLGGKVLAGIGGGCDEEALRVARLMQFYVPKNHTGGKLIFHKNVDIHFKLPTQANQTPEQTDAAALSGFPRQPQYVSYTVTVTPAVVTPGTDQEADKNKTITYTITW